jgi:putative transcriptional regulator
VWVWPCSRFHGWSCARIAMGEQLRNRLREERARHNLTQADLASMVGVSRKTINTVENEVFIPSTVLALKLARALHTTVEKLFQLPD